MRTVQITAAKNQLVLADRCGVAEDFMSRFKGYMGTPTVPEGEGMWFPDCKSVHMWFMRVPLDIVFLRDRRVTSVHAGARPWSPLPVTDMRADSVLELPVGTIERCHLKPGDELCIS